MKYAMIPINRRYDRNMNRIVRWVLISYECNEDGTYKGTKILAKDKYFDNPNSSHQYLFEDDGFTLIENKYTTDFLVNQKRKYQYDAGLLYETAFEFEADSDKEAIKKFKKREI